MDKNDKSMSERESIPSKADLLKNINKKSGGISAQNDRFVSTKRKTIRSILSATFAALAFGSGTKSAGASSSDGDRYSSFVEIQKSVNNYAVELLDYLVSEGLIKNRNSILAESQQISTVNEDPLEGKITIDEVPKNKYLDETLIQIEAHNNDDVYIHSTRIITVLSRFIL